MEKLIRDAVKNKSDKLEVEFPRTDMVWKKIQEQQKLTNVKKRKKRDLGITGWPGIAAVLLIIIVLPLTVIKLINSTLVKETPSSVMRGKVATQDEIEEAKKAASSFLTEFYTIKDYNSFTEQDEKLYPNDNRTKDIRIYTTDEYYKYSLVPHKSLFPTKEDPVPNEGPLLIAKAAKNNKCNFQVDEISLTKYTENMYSEIILFHTEVHLKCKFNDGSEKPGTYMGDITMKRENNKWLVSDYKVTNYEPKEIFNNIYDNKAVWVAQYLLPHPYNPEMVDFRLSFRTKWPGIVMPEFTAQMQEMGWKLYDEKAEKKYYKKEIKISIAVYESKDPKEAFASTFMIVEIEN